MIKQLIIERLKKIQEISDEIEIDLTPYNDKEILDENLDNISIHDENIDSQFYYIKSEKNKARIRKDLIQLNDYFFHIQLQNTKEEISKLTDIVSSSLQHDYKNVLCATSNGFNKFFNEENTQEFVKNFLSKINKYHF